MSCYNQHANTRQRESSSLSLHLPFNRKDRRSPAVFSNLCCATTKDSFNESSKKKQQQLPRAFGFTDTIPQKQVRATNITGTLLTNNCILEQYTIFIETYLLLHQILYFTEVCSLRSYFLHFERLNLLNFQLGNILITDSRH